MMKSLKQKKIVAVSLLIIADLLFFSLINPVEAYAIVLVAGFCLLILTVFMSFDLFLTLIERIVPFSDHIKRRVVWIVTGLVGLLIAMQSIGQLTIRDILALLPLLIVGIFYFSYMGKQKSR